MVDQCTQLVDLPHLPGLPGLPNCLHIDLQFIWRPEKCHEVATVGSTLSGKLHVREQDILHLGCFVHVWRVVGIPTAHQHVQVRTAHQHVQRVGAQTEAPQQPGLPSQGVVQLTCIQKNPPSTRVSQRKARGSSQAFEEYN
eukprot:178593-Pelagomonas_calceolata.AAC.1